ncbi:MAG: GGDEF domain-containing protein [Oscillospiraceae bacterium]
MFIYQTCSDLFWNTLNETGEKSVFDLIDYDVIDAVVLFRDTFYDKQLLQEIAMKASAAGKPVIVIDGAISGGISGCANLLIGYKKGFENLVRHVVEHHGLRDIVMMAGIKGEVYSEERIHIFKQVMRENGICEKPDEVRYGDYWSKPTEKETAAILKEGSLPQAIICANDTMAIAVCSVLKTSGYSVPEDIIVTGFDGTCDAKLSTPSLSTCELSLQAIADQVTELLSKAFSGESINGIYPVGYQLLLEQSCGCGKTVPNDAGGRLKQLNDRFYRYLEEARSLHEMTGEILSCENPVQVSRHIGKFSFYNMCCLLNADCLDETADPTVKSDGSLFSEIMTVIFQADTDESFGGAFSRKDIVPDLDFILSKNNPLIFTAVNFLNIPLGYTCFHFTVDAESYLKIPQFVYALSNAVGGYRNVRFQKYMAAHIEQIYKYDSLTGLYNRNGFYKELTPVLNELREQPNTCLAVVSADLDGLKCINDTFGHDEGDDAICAVANALSGVRLENKLCARIGGDELLAIAPAASGAVDQDQIRREFMEALACYNLHSGKPYQVSSSIGVIVSDTNDIDFDILLKEADKLLYSDKTQKRNRRGS